MNNSERSQIDDLMGLTSILLDCLTSFVIASKNGANLCLQNDDEYRGKFSQLASVIDSINNSFESLATTLGMVTDNQCCANIKHSLVNCASACDEYPINCDSCQVLGKHKFVDIS